MKHTYINHTSLLVPFALLLGLSFCATAETTTTTATSSSTEQTISKTFSVSEGGKLTIDTDIGSIRVNTHQSDTLLLELHKQGKDIDEFTFEHQTNGKDVDIEGNLDGRYKGWGKNLKVLFTLTVPSTYNLQLETSGGAISVKDLLGDVHADTSGGSIEAEDIVGNVKLETSGGSINSDNVMGKIDAHTSGGSINITMNKQITDPADFNTSGGSITAYIDADMKIDIDASTSGGRVKTDFNVDGRVNKRSIRGKINGGGPELTLHTSGGSVYIKDL